MGFTLRNLENYFPYHLLGSVEGLEMINEICLGYFQIIWKDYYKLESIHNKSMWVTLGV